MAPRLVVRVPASSANLGPGFDSLGMALDLHAEIGLADDPADAERDSAAGASSTTGDAGDDDHDTEMAGRPALWRRRPIDEHHPATIAFQALGGEGRLWLSAPIPMGRGLGYSGAVRVAGAALAVVQRAMPGAGVATAANGDVLDRASQAIDAAKPAIIDVCGRLEGHDDNVAASLYGGVVATAGHRVVRVPVALDPAVVVWIPPHTTSTSTSRNALPASVPFDDAVYNVARATTLVAALAAGDVDALRIATGDALHQRRRLAASTGSHEALDVGLGAGAWCGWLSGSGPTIAFLCAPGDAADLAAALPAAGHTKQLRIDHLGATVHRGELTHSPTP